MANTDGKRLTEQQAADYVAAQDAGLPTPKGLDGVVFDNTTVDAHHRFATADERALGDRYDDERKRAGEYEARVERLRKQAGVAEPTPAPPAQG